MIGESEAKRFLDYFDDERMAAPKSLHYRFLLAARVVMDETKSAAERQDAVDQLNRRCSAFLDHLATVFVERSNRLSLLDRVEVPTYPEKPAPVEV